MARLPHHPLRTTEDLDPLLQAIGDARVVLLGEASHGTHEYYTWRAKITRRLILEKGFQFIAVEGDWPDCFEINQAIKAPDGRAATELLRTFNRWPTWMWGNWEIAALVEWLRQHNIATPEAQRVGFYGLDVYSLWESLEQIQHYAGQQGEAAVEAARRAYRCFEPYSGDPQEYAEAVAFVSQDCQDEVVAMLHALRQKPLPAGPDGQSREIAFATDQNALVAVNAERYYKAMVRGGASSWNVRDEHMMATLHRLFDLHGPGAKAIVWAHNTHIGDARFTDMAGEGMVNVGQLARKALGRENVFAVGFGSYEGTVIASHRWGDPFNETRVPPARRGSWEDLLYNDLNADAILLSAELRAVPGMRSPIDHRAIGVVYNPEFERFGNYVPSLMAERYDAFFFLERTKALHPLDIQTDTSVPPDLYPWVD